MPEVWPFIPDDNLTDSYEFFTDVMRTRTTEKRVVVRSNPQRYVSMSHTLTDETFALYKAIAKRVSSDGEILVPLWIDAVFAQQITIGQVEFFFTTADFDFSTQLILWNSPFDFELLDIASIASGSVTVTVGASKDRSSVFIVPVRTCFATDGFSISRNAFNYHSGSEKFKIVDDDQIGESFSTTEHFGVSVIPTRPTRNNSLSEKIITTTTESNNSSGPFKISAALDFVDFYQTVEFKLSSRSQIRTIRDFVCSLKGKSEPFWLPSYFNEITLIGNANSTATIKKVLIASEYVGKHVFIQMKNGTIYTRKIATASNSGDDIFITFSVSIGVTINAADIQQFCFMTLVRSDSDIFEFSYDTGLNSFLSFSVLEVPEVL